jgi:hypothetical protein
VTTEIKEVIREGDRFYLQDVTPDIRDDCWQPACYPGSGTLATASSVPECFPIDFAAFGLRYLIHLHEDFRHNVRLLLRHITAERLGQLGHVTEATSDVTQHLLTHFVSLNHDDRLVNERVRLKGFLGLQKPQFQIVAHINPPGEHEL